MAAGVNRAPPRALYCALAFLASFLLFQIEVIATKSLLPTFGGAAYVWTACMMFFQGCLLAGYVYSRLALSRWSASAYARFHLALLAAPAVLFPISIAAGPIGARPVLQVLAALAGSIGLPFFVLSTTTPVVQAWLRAASDEHAEGSYSVFGASNAGALAALLSYPFLVEPALSLRGQLRLWEALYAGLAALHWFARPRGSSPAPAPEAAGRDRAAVWLLLSLGTSACLLASTNLLLLDFAAVPLLWIAPLAVYLATFVLNFKRRPWYPRRVSLVVLAAVLLWAALVLVTVLYSADFAGQWAAFRRLWLVNKFAFILGALFIVGMISHRALAQSKPPPERSAGFYLWIGLGGWLGSILIGVILPWAGRRLAMPELDWAVSGLICIGALALKARGEASPTEAETRTWPVRAALGAVIVLGCAAFGFYANRSLAFAGGRVLSLRNFYGYYAVTESGGLRKFYHGNTLHGIEYVDPARRDVPLLYYHRRSPLAECFEVFGPSASRIGVVGLGVGSMAAYARPGQSLDFYELDPDVAAIARERFDFLRDARAETRISTGDARTSLAAEGGARYDILVLDAFAGGAIPVHLMTEEAFRLYLERLAPGGIVLVHITNRFLNLKPVLAAAAADLGLSGAAKSVDPRDIFKEELYYSSWVALSRDRARLAPLYSRGWKDLSSYATGARPWTDQFASLWSALGS